MIKRGIMFIFFRQIYNYFANNNIFMPYFLKSKHHPAPTQHYHTPKCYINKKPSHYARFRLSPIYI